MEVVNRVDWSVGNEGGPWRDIIYCEACPCGKKQKYEKYTAEQNSLMY
jgi:hypothetical protein